MSDPVTLASLEAALRDARAVDYGIVAALAICIYDYLLTVGDEVELFWTNMDHKSTRVLYFVASN